MTNAYTAKLGSRVLRRDSLGIDYGHVAKAESNYLVIVWDNDSKTVITRTNARYNNRIVSL